jgi:hypothetical protein
MMQARPRPENRISVLPSKKITFEGIVSRKLLIGGHLQALEMVKVQAIAGP